MKAAELKRLKREEANARQAERNNRTDQTQLLRLDTKFGPGKGAKRERARLQKRIDAQQNKENKGK